MNRRKLIQLASTGAFASAVTAREAAAQESVARATRGLATPKIKDVSVIACAPAARAWWWSRSPPIRTACTATAAGPSRSAPTWWCPPSTGI